MIYVVAVPESVPNMVLIKCDINKILKLITSFSRNFAAACSKVSLSRSPRDSLKCFEISAPQHIGFAELRKI